MKLKNLHNYFFYLFLLSIPFQTRKVFLTKYSFYSGAFTEYATFFVYASDVLLILTLFFWLVFNKKLHKHLNLENLKNARELSFIWLFSLAFIIWLTTSAIVNNNYTEISAFYILKFVEFFLLIIYVYFNLRNKKRLIIALFAISLTGFFQGLIAIYQFTSQSPLFKHPFLHKLTGESTIYPQLSGIAKIIVDDEKFIRAYGTFPHPNLLGGFLIASILISIYLLLNHKDYILSRLSLQYNNINNNKSQARTSLLLSLSWIIFIFTQIAALLFTFSRTSWMGFLIFLFLIILFYIYHFLIVSRETIKKNRIIEIKTFPFSLFQNFFRYNNFKKNIWNQICFVFAKIIRKISSIKFFWISTFKKIKKALGDSGNKHKPKFSEIVSRETISENLNNKKSIHFLCIFETKIRNFGTKLQEYVKYNLKYGNFNIAKKQYDLIPIIFTKERACCRLFYHFKELIIIILLTLILVIAYFPYINSRMNESLSINNFSSSDYLPSNYAFNDRIFYNNVSRETISENFILGSGPGTFIFQIKNYLTKNNINQKLEPWQYQPAHNIYLLIISEIGIVGFAILTLLIIKIIVYGFKSKKTLSKKRFFLNNNYGNSSIVSRETIETNKIAKNQSIFYIFKKNMRKILFTNTLQTLIIKITNNKKLLNKTKDKLNNKNKIVSRETISENLNYGLNYYLFPIFITFLFIGLFDHYFWTLQQGKLMIWLILGLILVSNKTKQRS